MLLQDPDLLLKHACPLVHPADYAVRVRHGVIPIYRNGCLDIGGLPYYVEHNIEENIKRRQALLKKCEDNPHLTHQWLYAVSRPSVSSLILWINWFVWTFVQQEIDETGHQKAVIPGRMDPMVLWPCQDRFAAELYYALTLGYDWCVDKSRQMGATWLIACVFAWFCLYRPNVHFDVLSQTEEEVDNPADPQSIFWKLDFILKKLPPWLAPAIDRAHLRFANIDLNSTIMGRSTTSKKGRGGAKTGVLFDEAALNEKLESIWTGYGQSCASRGANSTPHGPGFFAEIVQNQPNVHKIVLPWWEHPIKGRGRFIEIDPDSGAQFVSSPFYIEQCKRASPDPTKPYLARKTRQIAQELDLDHTGGGRTIFDTVTINRQMSMVPPHPEYRGDLRWHGDKGTRLTALQRGDMGLLEFVPASQGRWEFWCEFFEDEDGRWRPLQNRTYIFGEDISQGVGSSDSVIVVFCPEEGKKVAQYRNPHISPVKFAIVAAQAGYWFGGHRGMALQAPEANGVGQAFIKTLVRLRYPWIFQDRDEMKKGAETSKGLGWHSNREKKRNGFYEFNDAMGRGEFIDPSYDSLKQCQGIINYPGSGCGPARLSEETEDARALHGDIVTANFLSWYASKRVGLARPPKPRFPMGSQAWLRANPQVIRGPLND